VFVSSTLGELADERRAVSRAIGALRLTPVMFELGARPYPPREVYQQYLAQSDVFIGLYWQRYGQPAPGMQVSGLEEEFDLSGALPRLLYVKAPAAGRDPRLGDLLARIEDDASASYRHFRTPAELGRLVRDDLAVLLSERFAAAAGQAAAAVPSPAVARGPRPLPVSTTPLIGRERAIGEVAGLFEQPGVRLVTLTGPGGVGKTRLAVAVGERLRGRFGAGTAFVPLESVTDSGQVLAAIGWAAGADLAGVGAPLEALAETFGDGAWLLVLDNLEQVVQVAPDLGELLARCPGVAILATSRTVLGLRAEREYPVPPLALPADPGTASVAEVAASPAVALFVDRARAVRPGFALTEGNAVAVAEICRRLEGVPLAIELAAARTRLLDPAALLDRLAASLDALGTGAVDLPGRQRTLRATVEWSVGLLEDAERSLLEVTAVFTDGWTIPAAAQVAGLDEDRALELCEALARHSLVAVDSTGLGPGRGCWRRSGRSWPSGWRPGPTPPRSGAGTLASTGRWPSRPTGRCAAPGGANGRSGCRPRRATWPPRCAGTWRMTAGRCRTCSGSCICSGRSGTSGARPGHGWSSCCPALARWTRRPAPSWPGRRRCSPATSGTTRRRWRPASAWRRCCPGSRIPSCTRWPSWRWRGPCRSPATTAGHCGRRRPRWRSSAARTSLSSPPWPR
jgi:predicted ATPase